MANTQDIIMLKFIESKLQSILNAIIALSICTAIIKGVIGGFQHNQPLVNLEGGAPFIVQQAIPPQPFMVQQAPPPQ